MIILHQLSLSLYFIGNNDVGFKEAVIQHHNPPVSSIPTEKNCFWLNVDAKPWMIDV